jgi:DNA adenine methylase
MGMTDLFQRGNSQNEIVVTPPLKWAGGKRWFMAKYKDLLPMSYGAYYEPFLGSGAVFFNAMPKRAVLSDINDELINLYRIIRDEPVELAIKMNAHQRRHSTEYYYEIRAKKLRSDLNKAARTLYLNRTCWNGLYRVNLNGEFNVPKGTKDTVVMESDNFNLLSKVLKKATILCQDFEETLDRAKRGDFAFIDPPYTVAHNHNGFVKYNQHLFEWEDQIRLRNAVERAANRGVKVLVTNAAHQSVFDLYDGFKQVIVERSGVISSSSNSRGRYQEMVALCY